MKNTKYNIFCWELYDMISLYMIYIYIYDITPANKKNIKEKKLQEKLLRYASISSKQ